VATKNSWQPFNSVRYTNALCALPSILRYYLPREDPRMSEVSVDSVDTLTEGVGELCHLWPRMSLWKRE